MWERELAVAKEAAIRAGGEIMRIYDTDFTDSIKYKKDESPLTVADIVSNKLIVDVLSKEFPEYAILSEEKKDDVDRLSNPLCFIIDPLDGTKEFIKRNGQFTVNIALSNKHKSVMGVIYVPVTHELYFASEGSGAYLQKADRPVERIHVSDNIDTYTLSAVVSSSHLCDEMEQMIQKYHISKLKRIGSSLKGCLVAKGDADIYYRHNPTMEWDTAAMQCIVEEAGGIFRQMDDSELFYNREDSLNHKGFYAINRLENRLY
ncbi:3'(2'),5'-bisphosphate nucleotidase [Butyrivibrio sp. CB08]|uniref:3'(2'),5'-bisphosphate nucleotidase CysQ n=1 Tax=Butyrivibrio sp. CB08 TaxID=2364879 RepID=UPI000EA928DC|nr:3'(2'),5'-bisphosphate nucleotidase CysQ [Butyrivibrio sp. CB08]RKM57872.1 3'(2'),5'-bisphosphate nucleotidase [Butyrivibrio sp. CB08]